MVHGVYHNTLSTGKRIRQREEKHMKCAVPLFFMISGAVLLGKQESVRELFSKRILHFGVIWVLFVFLQYLPAYMGYLLILPVLRKLVKGLQHRDYLYLFALDGIFILVSVVQIFTGYRLNMSLALLSNTVFYPLAGYYLTNILQIQNRRTACVTAISAVLASIAAGCVLQQMFHLRSGVYTDLAASAVTDIIAVAMFILVKEAAEKIHAEDAAGKIIVAAGEWCVWYISDRGCGEESI